jgi:predicted nucleic acid-binding protein
VIRAFLDANVLYPPTIRGVLLELAQADVFAPLWSEMVHVEWMRSLAEKRPNIPPAAIKRLRALMDTYVGDVTVTGYEHLIDTLVLPDPNDRHILAAAIHGQASVIVTNNLKDFPASALAPHNIIAQSADSFVLGLITADGAAVAAALAEDRADLVKPPVSADDYLVMLGRGGLGQTAAALMPMKHLL